MDRADVVQLRSRRGGDQGADGAAWRQPDRVPRGIETTGADVHDRDGRIVEPVGEVARQGDVAGRAVEDIADRGGHVAGGHHADGVGLIGRVARPGNS